MAMIIDTDIGSDIDDAIAIAYALKANIDIKLITTVHGPVKKRAQIAKKLTQQLGHDIPVAIGECYPIKQRHIFITGLEGKGYIEDNEPFDIDNNGIAALIDTIYNNKGITIAAIGPLTNIAKAFQQEPNIEQYIGHIYVMGNAIITPYTFHLNYRAHNLKADPEAADIVFNTEIPKTIVTTEVCKKNYLTKEDINQFKGNPALDYIRKDAAEWMNFIKYDVAYLYDPLVIHHYIDDTITQKVEYNNTKITTDVRPTLSEYILETILK